MFEYFTKRYDTIKKLQDGLTEKGKENWRLHTCEEMNVGRFHWFFVVMDRTKCDNSEPEGGEEKEEAMPCKG